MWYAIIGRIPGDDEDSCLVFECDSLTDAAVKFFDAMTDEMDADSKRQIEEQYGQLVYITHRLQSETPITYA